MTQVVSVCTLQKVESRDSVKYLWALVLDLSKMYLAGTE